MFYWYSGRDDDERFLARVNADSETVKKLLNEYRKSDPEGYNSDGFINFLRERGIEAEIIDPDEWIYF